MWEIIASIGGTASLAAVTWGVKKIQAHDTAITLLTSQIGDMKTMIAEGRAETREGFKEVNETVSGLTSYLLRNPPSRG